MVLAAPGLLTTVELATRPLFWKMRCTRRAITSGEPPGDEPTTSSTGLLGFHCCAATGEMLTAGAPHPAANPKTNLNGRIIPPLLPVTGYRTQVESRLTNHDS